MFAFNSIIVQVVDRSIFHQVLEELLRRRYYNNSFSKYTMHDASHANTCQYIKLFYLSIYPYVNR